MKIVLFGKDGQIGCDLSRHLSDFGQLFKFGRNEVDLTNHQNIEYVLNKINPTIIINAAAYTSVENAENEQEIAHLINHHAVGVMANYSARNQCILIHYSTDYVFDGAKKSPYTESDIPNPLNKYGDSKLGGENVILNSGCCGFIFRTSWVFSIFGNNFVKKILELAKEKKELRVVSDQYGAPTSTELISKITVLAIKAALDEKINPGLYHISSAGYTSWFQLACYVIEQYRNLNIDMILEPTRIIPVTTEQYASIVDRPKNSVLNNDLILSKLNFVRDPWQVYVDRVLQQLYEIGYLV